LFNFIKKYPNLFKNFDGDPNIRPVHGSFKIWLLTFILLGAFFGLTTRLFIWLGVPTFAPTDVIISEFQQNIAFQGVHFLAGVILGYMFDHPAAGLSFGVLKEFTDIFKLVRQGRLTEDALRDVFIDLIFWTGGGLVGYYLLANVQYLLRKNEIKGLKDLTWFAIKKVADRTNGDKKKGA